MEIKHQWTSEEYLEYLRTGKKPTEQTPKEAILKPVDNTSKPKEKKVAVSTKTLSDERLAIFNLLKFKLEDGTAIWLPGNTPSQKNSKEIGQMILGKYSLKEYLQKNKTNTKASHELCSSCSSLSIVKMRPTLRSSKMVEEYKHEHKHHYTNNTWLFKQLTHGMQFPIHLGLYFIRKSANEFDYINAAQIIQDMATEAGWYADDNTNIVWPVFLGTHKDADNPGCIVIPLHNYLENTIKTI